MAKGYSARRGFSNGAGQAAQQMQMQQKLMQMQQEMAKAQQEVEEATFTASVGGGAVSAAANGKKEITALTIKPEAVDPEDVEMLQDLVISAVNEALRQPHEQLHQRSEHPRSGAISAEYSKETPPTGRRLLFYFWLRRSPAARSVLRRKMAESVRLTSSAMGNDHHTSSSRPVRESRYATGSSTQIWRQTETIRL